MKKPLSNTIKRFYGIGDFGFSMMSAGLETPYLVFFMTNVAKFDLGLIALTTTIASIIDAFMQPVYGGLITGTKAGKHGRNRSWLVIWPVFVIITFITMFTNIGGPVVGCIIVAASLCLTNAARSLPWVAHLNLISVLSDGPDSRAKLASTRAVWSSAGGILAGFLIPMFLRLMGETNVMSYTVTAAFASLFYAATVWFTFSFTKGYEPVEASTGAAAARVTIMDMLRAAAGNPPLLILLFADFFKYISGFVLSASLMYYFTYVANIPTVFGFPLMSAYQTGGSICATLGASFTGRISKKLTTKGCAVFALFMQGSFLTLNFFLAKNTVIFFLLIFAYRFVVGIGTAAVVALYSDCVVYSRWKTGKNTAAFIFGSQTFALKLAYVSRSTLVPAILAAVGFSANIDASQVTETFKNGVLLVFLLIPGLSTLLTATVLLFFYRLTRDKILSMEAEIKEREAAAQA